MKATYFAKRLISRIYDHFFADSLFRQTAQEREAQIASFPEPSDLLDCSYFQYLSQMRSVPWLMKSIQNLASIPALVYILQKKHKIKEKSLSSETDAVFFSEVFDDDIIPSSLQKEMPNRIRISDLSSWVLQDTDKRYIRELIRRFPWKPYFALKCAVKLGIYARAIYLYHPKAFIVYDEYSFTSSMLTDYCHHNGILHYNVLHGERLLNTRDVFATYDRFYVWNESYKQLFIMMRCPSGQFYVERPPMFDRILPCEEIRYDLTYYLGRQTRSQLQSLKDVLILLNKNGISVCIRMHPRYSNPRQIKSMFSFLDIEDPAACPIDHSIARTRAVCSVLSTVMYQAYSAGKEIVIDDISYHERYELICSLHYPMLKQPHMLLSELRDRYRNSKED